MVEALHKLLHLQLHPAHAIREAVVDVLVSKAIAACLDHNVPRLLLGGGVIANRRLREVAQQRCEENGIELRIPALSLCTDNGAMIAFAGAMRLMKNPQLAKKHWGFDVKPRWPLDQISI